MDPSTAVRTDTLPAIATLVVPGSIASIGYIWLGLGAVPPAVLAFIARQEAVVTVIVILICVAVGFAVDSTGSYVEVYLMDRRRKDWQRQLDDWWRYLAIAWKTEPVGQHYLRRLLVTFKFELNMGVALAISLPSVPMLVHYGLLVWWRGWIAAVCLAAAMGLCFFAANSSSKVLADVRRRLLEGVWEPTASSSIT
jgi:hypothetical protein